MPEQWLEEVAPQESGGVFKLFAGDALGAGTAYSTFSKLAHATIDGRKHHKPFIQAGLAQEFR